jgi:hypothetical protein
VTDQIAVVQLEVNAGAENVGAVDMVVQVSGEWLAGIFEDGGDVFAMPTSTEDNHWTHS